MRLVGTTKVRPGRVPCLVVAVFVLVVAAECGGASTGRRAAPSSTVPLTTSTTAPLPTTTSAARTGPEVAEEPCPGVPPPATYAHVVVVMLENRTWSDVGGPGFGAMPYLRGLAQRCAFYTEWTETNRAQSSLTQYIGLTSGVDNPRTVDDCNPSAACSSTDDNVFRQVRQAGGTARSYVEGASDPCSAAGNAPKHVPALYYRGAYQDATGTHTDTEFCATEVRPATELDPNHLPTFAMVTPTLCNDGHDCPNSTVDEWARAHVGAILAGDDYRAGTTAVFVLWDEDFPVPNLVVAPSARPGPRPGAASHAAALKTIEELLGLSVLPQGQLVGAPDLRTSAPL